MTFVLEGGNLLFFITVYSLLLFVSLNEFKAPDHKLEGCDLHPNQPTCAHRKEKK